MLKKIIRNLKRPIPDLARYCLSKIFSIVWKQYLAEVGGKFHVWNGARFQGARAIHIGKSFYSGPGLWIEAVQSYCDHKYNPVIKIGDNVTCSDSVHIAATDSVCIGNGVLIGSRVYVSDHAHGSYTGEWQDSPSTPPAYRKLPTGRPVQIGDNVWLGDGVVILPGVTVGNGVIVGANSVVSKNLPDNVIAVGIPAKVIKKFSDFSGKWERV